MNKNTDPFEVTVDLSAVEAELSLDADSWIEAMLS